MTNRTRTSLFAVICSSACLFASVVNGQTIDLTKRYQAKLQRQPIKPAGFVVFELKTATPDTTIQWKVKPDRGSVIKVGKLPLADGVSYPLLYVGDAHGKPPTAYLNLSREGDSPKIFKIKFSEKKDTAQQKDTSFKIVSHKAFESTLKMPIAKNSFAKEFPIWIEVLDEVIKQTVKNGEQSVRLWLSWARPPGTGVLMTVAVESRPSRVIPRIPNAQSAFDQYLGDIQRLPLITDVEEEKRLARRAQTGDAKAAERLVTSNLRFVISYVKKYQGHGLDLSELVAIGNEGLLKAVRKFDPDQGVKFISYAVWWVRQAVLKALAEQTRSVRIPLNQNSQLIRLARAETVLSQVLKRDPTDSELGRLLEENPDTVRSSRQMSAAEISLDAPVDRSDREASTLGERFVATDNGEIEESTDANLTREFIDRAFKKHLTPRERKILYLYYGLGNNAEAMTLEKIGLLLGVTRERIRQIRERAFEKLRTSEDGGSLSGLWTTA